VRRRDDLEAVSIGGGRGGGRSAVGHRSGWHGATGAPDGCGEGDRRARRN
jgi:hypothetical protein